MFAQEILVLLDLNTSLKEEKSKRKANIKVDKARMKADKEKVLLKKSSFIEEKSEIQASIKELENILAKLENSIRECDLKIKEIEAKKVFELRDLEDLIEEQCNIALNSVKYPNRERIYLEKLIDRRRKKILCKNCKREATLEEPLSYVCDFRHKECSFCIWKDKKCYICKCPKEIKPYSEGISIAEELKVLENLLEKLKSACLNRK